MQQRTSAGTSINSKKLPALYTKLAKLGVMTGTGIGTETQAGMSWQRNQKLRSYEAFCDGLKVQFKNGIMIVRR